MDVCEKVMRVCVRVHVELKINRSGCSVRFVIRDRLRCTKLNSIA